MCINKRYIFDDVFEKQPFGKIYKINLSPEAAIKMLFEKLIQYCYSPIIVKLFEKPCGKVTRLQSQGYCAIFIKFLLNLHVTLSNLETLLWKFKYFITVLMLNNYSCRSPLESSSVFWKSGENFNLE